jgi:hypothetical protein
MAWFQGLQLIWAVLVVALVVERAVALFLRLPTSSEGAKFVTVALQRAELAQLRAWSQQRPHTLLAQLLASESDPDDNDPALLWADLATRPFERLLWLRVSATVSSTLGLLGGVVAIARGMGQKTGLVALQAGLGERLAMRDAMFSMALGLGTAAVCFYSLGRLRRAAGAIVAQGRSIAHLLTARVTAGKEALAKSG